MTKTKAKREEGFYWVRHTETEGGEWTICWWSADEYTQWMFTGQEHSTYNDDMFADIDECRLVRPESESMETIT